MKKTYLLIVLSFIIFSCNKTEETLKPIDINFELKDDVSPVVAQMSLNGNYDLIEWVFEDIYSPSERSPNPAFHIFGSKGYKNIEVRAINNNTGEKFYKKITVEIPDVAKKLKITGIFFKNLPGSNPFNQKASQISLNYIKKGNEDLINLSIPAKSLSATDTLLFADPIVLDIDRFLEDKGEDHMISLISKIGNDQSLTIKTNFFLKGVYLGEHPWTPEYIQLNDQNSNGIGYVYLLCDWMPK